MGATVCRRPVTVRPASSQHIMPRKTSRRSTLAKAALGVATVAAAFNGVQAGSCDFSQVASNPHYGKDNCDANFAGQYAITLPCGAGYAPCDSMRNEMMGCGKDYAPHANCKFGDSFIGKIGCQYDGKVLLPEAQQPVTCTSETTWCAPCGYDNDGQAKRVAGLWRSDPRPWSSHYAEENLLPKDYMTMTVADWEKLGWYTTNQDYLWCNVGGKCYEICTDGHDCTEGGCGDYTGPTAACGATPSPTPPPPTPPSPKKCDWKTANVKCKSESDCKQWELANCAAGTVVSYCKVNGSCHFNSA